MTQEAAVPASLRQQIMRWIRDEVANQARSAPLRNSSISDGGITIKGGFLKLVWNAITLFYVGPLGPNQPDGTPQQGMIIRRADGTFAMALFDASPSVDGIKQALTWYDRGTNVVFADDTESGQGIARPFIPGVFYQARNNDWPLVTSTTFETVYRAKMPNQQPKLFVRVWGVNNTAGATGEIRVLVNGVQLGTTIATASGTVTEYLIGPLPVTGAHMSTLAVEVQARLATGAGGVQVAPSALEGRQT